MSTNHPKEEGWIETKNHPRRFPNTITAITKVNIKTWKDSPLQEWCLSIITKIRFQDGENSKQFALERWKISTDHPKERARAN